jgi:4-hydroxybenzoate polyprenyltransferase
LEAVPARSRGRAPEDANVHDGNAAAFLRRFRAPSWALFGLLAVAQLWLVLLEPKLLLSILLSVAVSVFYFFKVPLLGKRAKEIPYFKCFYLSGCALVVVGAFTPGMWGALKPPGLSALVLSFSLFFLNFSLYDIKDIDGDARANIKTFAAALSPRSFLGLHVSVALALGGLSLVVLPGGAGRVLAAVFAFHALMSRWLRHHHFSAALCGAIDGGYGLILGVGTLLLRP